MAFTSFDRGDQKVFSPEFMDEAESIGSLMDHHSLLSPTSSERKDSFAAPSSTFFSPQSSGSTWDERYASSPDPTSRSTLTNHYQEPHSMTYLNQASWFGFQRTDETKPATVPSSYEPFNQPTAASFPTPPSDPAYGMPIVQPAVILSSAGPLATHMALAEREVEANRMIKRDPRPMSPGYPRRDPNGVRKKNSRFEIPPGRSLQNIDHLIASSHNEEEKKELKAQKRLLRNRQAALDSRQRKKKHTEDLEKETRVLNRERSSLQSEIDALRAEMENLQMENDELNKTVCTLSGQVEDMMIEKGRLISDHTLESGELRRKITVLKEQLENVPVNPAPQAPSEFTEFTNDLEMDSEWGNNFGWINDAPEAEPQAKPRGPETTLVVGQGRKDAPEEGRSTFGGLPFTLPLIFGLVGAFVASSGSSTALSQIKLPDAYRAEATNIIQNVLSEPQPSSGPALQASQADGNAPAPSMPTWVQSDGTALLKNGLRDIRPASTLESLTAKLVTPSKQQEAEAAFSMTPAQYNSLTSSDFTRRDFAAPSEEDDAAPETRKSLSERLRQRASNAPTNADVYTRSLLLERIPSDVLQEFRRIVRLSDTEPSMVKEERSQ